MLKNISLVWRTWFVLCATATWVAIVVCTPWFLGVMYSITSPLLIAGVLWATRSKVSIAAPQPKIVTSVAQPEAAADSVPVAEPPATTAVASAAVPPVPRLPMHGTAERGAALAAHALRHGEPRLRRKAGGGDIVYLSAWRKRRPTGTG